jgi:hypothetical protein
MRYTAPGYWLRIGLAMVRADCGAGTPPLKPNQPLFSDPFAFKNPRPAPRQTLAD